MNQIQTSFLWDNMGELICPFWTSGRMVGRYKGSQMMAAYIHTTKWSCQLVTSYIHYNISLYSVWASQLEIKYHQTQIEGLGIYIEVELKTTLELTCSNLSSLMIT